MMIDWTKIVDGCEMPDRYEQCAWCWQGEGDGKPRTVIADLDSIKSLSDLDREYTHWARVTLPGESSQVPLTMYPSEVRATEKALRMIVVAGAKSDMRVTLRQELTADDENELEDAWCRVFEPLSKAMQADQPEGDG